MHNIFEDLSFTLPGSANGMSFGWNGSSVNDAYYNLVRDVWFQYTNGDGLVLAASDSNLLEDIHENRASGGTGTGVYIYCGAEDNHIRGLVAGGGGVTVLGTPTCGSSAATTDSIELYDQYNNGDPVPSAQAGTSFWCSNDADQPCGQGAGMISAVQRSVSSTTSAGGCTALVYCKIATLTFPGNVHAPFAAPPYCYGFTIQDTTTGYTTTSWNATVYSVTASQVEVLLTPLVGITNNNPQTLVVSGTCQIGVP